MSEAAITIGNGIPVGNVIVDPRAIKGAGSWYNPYLYIPIKIQMYARNDGEHVALIRLTASLHLTEIIDINNQFGDRVSYDLLYNMPNRSTVEQRASIGLLSDFVYPWLAGIGTLRIETAEMKWTENIFPNIGYDRYRLVEVSLPTSDILVPQEAIDYFQKAKKYYDEGNNIECLRECRLALEEIEKHLSVQGHKLGTAITKKLGWPDQPQLTEQAKFLDSTWVGLFMLANAASHTPSTRSLLPADAYTGFLSIAVMLEYLGQLE